MSTGMEDQRISTGVEYADQVLDGGLIPKSGTLVRGAPGAGKTIFGVHFLTAGAPPGTRSLYINLGEPAEYFDTTSDSFGLDTDSVEVLDLSPSQEQFSGAETYDLFRSSEVERPSLVESIRDEVTALDPDRVLIDPITELRYLTSDEHQFRTQVLSLLEFLKAEGATVVLTSQAASSIPDDDLQFLVDTVIDIDVTQDRRTLTVSKFRGSSAQRGQHTVTITDDGMRVWPRLAPSRYRAPERSLETLPSDVPELDALLSGGLTTGTITFVSGPTGVGKTTTALQFVDATGARDGRSVLYSFEEGRETMLRRTESIGIPIRDRIDEGSLVIEEISPEEITVDEFTHRLRTQVEDQGTELVVLDGITGFEKTLRGIGDDPAQHLIKIGRYLRNMNTTGVFTNEVHQITGGFHATEQRISHLADGIIVLRHVEYKGELRKVIGVLKMRTTGTETRLREFSITEDGLVIGEPLTELRGILTGTPDWKGDE